MIVATTNGIGRKLKKAKQTLNECTNLQVYKSVYMGFLMCSSKTLVCAVNMKKTVPEKSLLS